MKIALIGSDDWSNKIRLSLTEQSGIEEIVASTSFPEIGTSPDSNADESSLDLLCLEFNQDTARSAVKFLRDVLACDLFVNSSGQLLARRDRAPHSAFLSTKVVVHLEEPIFVASDQEAVPQEAVPQEAMSLGELPVATVESHEELIQCINSLSISLSVSLEADLEEFTDSVLTDLITISKDRIANELKKIEEELRTAKTRDVESSQESSRQIWDRENNWNYDKYKLHLTGVKNLLKDRDGTENNKSIKQVPALLLLSEYTRFLINFRKRASFKEAIVRQPSIVPRWHQDFATTVANSKLLAAFLQLLMEFDLTLPRIYIDPSSKNLVVEGLLEKVPDQSDSKLFSDFQLELEFPNQETPNQVRLEIPAA